MGKLLEIIRNLFPILQPEWILCKLEDIPKDTIIAFNEEEEYQKRIGKNKMDIKIKGYRYILRNKKEIFMMRRKVSLI